MKIKHYRIMENGGLVNEAFACWKVYENYFDALADCRKMIEIEELLAGDAGTEAPSFDVVGILDDDTVTTEVG